MTHHVATVHVRNGGEGGAAATDYRLREEALFPGKAVVS